MIENLKKLLHEGENGHSLIVQSETGDEAFIYDGRGISDLLNLLTQSPDMLLDTTVADKVVGKAAAALMILGGVKVVYADTISELALQLFANEARKAKKEGRQPIKVAYDKKVEYIVNRTNTGWCPMETACKDAKTPAECLVRIQEKLKELKGISIKQNGQGQ